MACNELNGLGSNCIRNLGGIKKVWIFPFKDIDQYVYTNDNLNVITGYSTSTLPAIYLPNKKSSEYKGQRSINDYRFYDHQLILGFPKMEVAKREELNSLEAMDLTIIFQDENDICWIMGQDYPVKMNEVSLGTGVKMGQNSYEFIFKSKEKQHIREISKPSDDCFVSFRGVQLTISTFEIPEADSLVWQNFLIAGNTNVGSYNAATPLTMNLATWVSNPATYTSDVNQLQYLFETIGTIEFFTMTMSVGNVVTINAYSFDTNYNIISIDGTPFQGTSQVILNLQTVLSPQIANSSTLINLSDNDELLFSVGYGEAVTGVTGVNGLSNNFNIYIASEYATGQTFTMEISGLTCSTLTYEYTTQELLDLCSLDVDFDFYKGQLVRINIPTIQDAVDTPRFQNIQFSLYGYMYNMYMKMEDWHNDYAQFQTDFVNLVGTIPIPIDLSSISFVDGGTSVDIDFYMSSISVHGSNPYFKTYVRGYVEPATTFLGWTQSRVLNLVTSAPYPSIIVHTDEFFNEIYGENLVNIQHNDFDLSTIPTTSNNSIENVGLIWAFDESLPYAEGSIIETTDDSLECFTVPLETSLVKCYESFTSEQLTSFEIINLDCTSGDTILGADFTIEYNNGSYHFDVISLPLGVTPSSNMQYLTKALNDIKGMNVIYMDYNPVTRKYFIHLEIESTFSLLSFTETTNGRSFDLGTIIPIYLNRTNRVNPYVEMEWSSLPTIFPIAPMPSVDMMYGFWSDLVSNSIAVRFIWDSTGDTITLDKLAIASTVESNFIVSLHDTYPTTTNAVAVYELPSGVTTNITFTGITAELIASGSSIADVNFMLYTNYLGWGYVQPLDMTADEDYFFQESNRLPLVWGTMDYLKYLGTTGTTVAPTITSVVCTETCCDDLTPPVEGNTTSNIVNVSGDTFNVEIDFTEAIDCAVNNLNLIFNGVSFLAPTQIGSVGVQFILGDCVGGIRKYNAVDNITFSSDPTGYEYNITVNCYDISATLIHTYVINHTF